MGEVIKWVKYYNLELLKKEWAVSFPTIPSRESCLACLLTVIQAPDAFLNFVPQDASKEEIQALRTWYDAKRGQDFVITRPQDFR